MTREIRLEPMIHTPVSGTYVIVKDKDQYHWFPVVGGSNFSDKVQAELFPHGKTVFEAVYRKGVSYKHAKNEIGFLTAVLNQKGVISYSTLCRVARGALEVICDPEIIKH